MAHDGSEQWITPTRGAKTLPTVEILTGRGFITGKSGSGKSNTASVIAEELLECNFNLLIVDPEGEYYGLKERYQMLHVGADEMCDVQVGPQHAGKIAEIALTKNMPVILDVSDFLDGAEAKDLISRVVEELYHLEKDVRKPFLLMIEEMQEYMPQSGGSDDLAELLERVAKRGRKRGLGMLGMSQRPSSVDKDFITQCDWMVWHKLTWKNDVDVVANILGKEKAAEVEDFETGEGYLMTDWDDVVERIQFKKKRTHDAGATPGLESYERPDLKSVGNELISEFGDESDAIDESRDPLDEEGVDNKLENGDVVAATLGDFEDEEEVADLEVVTAPEDTVGEFGGRAYENMEDEELRDAAKSLERRNQVLSDEVSELRSILKEVDIDNAVETAGNDSSNISTSPVPARGSHVSESPGRQQPHAPRPTAPQRPPDRSGIAGNLIEFSEMIIYLLKITIYKTKLLASASRRDR